MAEVDSAEEDLAARGLWAAVQLYAGAGEREAARACAEDLVKLYGGAAEAGAAVAWLETAGAEEEVAPAEAAGPAHGRPPSRR